MTTSNDTVEKAGGVILRRILIGLLTILMLGYVCNFLALALHFPHALTMATMIRPEGNPFAIFMLVLFFITAIAGALFLTARRSAIEAAPTGPFDMISLFISRVGMLMITGILVSMFYEVIARYAFDAPTLWANELSLWLGAFVFLFAGLYAMQQRSHIRIYALYAIMPLWLKRAADIASTALITGFAAALIWGSFNEAYSRMLRFEPLGTAWNPPLPATVKPAILIIVVLVALQSISNLIADWGKTGAESFDEVDETEIDKIRRTLKEDET